MERAPQLMPRRVVGMLFRGADHRFIPRGMKEQMVGLEMALLLRTKRKKWLLKIISVV